ncbi:amidohydrolase family protein [Kordiimonas pumila]|uniref:Amidohydrolase family protein n=1 Tax=Kordiimonas pumila TaxID=2161677 RepID=A0ABV7D1C2_9PROT|nr:amidohydrolase family protein [Kordiimonas pumila]
MGSIISKIQYAGFLVLLVFLPMQAMANTALPLEPSRIIEFDTGEGTWISLDVSPDGKHIVFDLLGDIYLLNIKGGTAKAISTGMGFDTQPVFSPDGRRIAYVTDASGAENIWTMALDGRDKKQVSFQDTERALLSPEWSADGTYIYASLFRADVHGHALQRYNADGSGGVSQITTIKTETGTQSVNGAVASRDGQYLYYAHMAGGLELDVLEKWTIQRRNIATGAVDTLVAPVPTRLADPDGGTYFRPVISPDGTSLVYGTRYMGQTGLRIRNLENGDDRWLIYPVQHDQLQASHIQDILPRYTFMPDGKSLVLSKDGKIKRVDIATGSEATIAFKAHVAVGIGPNLKQDIRVETGPVQARLIQDAEQSPNGKKLVFSALGKVYVMALQDGALPQQIGPDDTPSFQPSWSPDGTKVVYVTWTARSAGHVWVAEAGSSAPPQRITTEADFYTHPVFSPDGKAIVVMRASNKARMHNYMEYGPVHKGSLLKYPLSGGQPEVLYSGEFGSKPLFSKVGDKTYLFTSAGLQQLEDGKLQQTLQVVGPGWYFMEGPAPVDGLKVSPDGKWALAQIAQQLYVVEVPADTEQPVTLIDPQVRYRKITDVGADYFDWADDGRTITWSIGSTFYRRPLSGVELFEPGSGNKNADSPEVGSAGLEAFKVTVEIPRDTPTGSVLLQGATIITEDSAGVLENADILVTDNKIAAIGTSGTLDVPDGTEIIDVQGRYIIPGMIDTHHHIADIRREIYDYEAWGPSAALAYGVTTLFDPSTLSIDMMSYTDLMDAGLMTGSRIYSTGPAIFSFNEFQSKDEIRQVLLRYRDHYRLRNLKMYKTGNRKVRQWFVEVAAELGMQPTTEGGLAMKHGLTQIIDGFAGHEHALPAVPLYKDVVELVSKSRVGYTLTLLITNGGYEGQDYFISRDDPQSDAKVNSFWPRFVINGKFYEQTWRSPSLYMFPATAESANRIVQAGGLLGIGAHGEAPGIGTHWEMEAHAMGGMKPADILHAATIGGAEIIGRQHDLGSLSVGKLADLVILSENPLVDIKNTRSITMVMKNGRLYEGDTLNELWPRKKTFQTTWFKEDGYIPEAATEALLHHQNIAAHYLACQ